MNILTHTESPVFQHGLEIGNLLSGIKGHAKILRHISGIENTVPVKNMNFIHSDQIGNLLYFYSVRFEFRIGCQNGGNCIGLLHIAVFNIIIQMFPVFLIGDNNLLNFPDQLARSVISPGHVLICQSDVLQKNQH